MKFIYDFFTKVYKKAADKFNTTQLYTKSIWCCRNQHTYFAISKIVDGETAWYIVLFGYEVWIGEKKPTFLNRDRKKNGVFKF